MRENRCVGACGIVEKFNKTIGPSRTRPSQPRGEDPMSSRSSGSGRKPRPPTPTIAKCPPTPAPSLCSAPPAILRGANFFPRFTSLAAHHCLAPRFRLVGFARSPMTDDAFRAIEQRISAQVRPGFRDSDSPSGIRAASALLHRAITTIPRPIKTCSSASKNSTARAISAAIGFSIFPTPPEIYRAYIEQLGKAGSGEAAG